MRGACIRLPGFRNRPMTCQDCLVRTRTSKLPSLEVLVDRMFDRVFEAGERAELLVWIQKWEAANPDVDAAYRITGWIDVAYEFQAQSEGRQPYAASTFRSSIAPACDWNRSLAFG